MVSGMKILFKNVKEPLKDFDHNKMHEKINALNIELQKEYERLEP